MGYARNAQGRLDPSDERYQLWGIGSRMSEISAAMALAQMAKLDKIVNNMHVRKWQIRNRLSDIAGITFRRIVDPDGDSGPFLIGRLEKVDTCRDFVAALRAEGIRGQEGSMAFLQMEEWGLHWHFNNQSLVKHRGVNSHGWPWTDAANAFSADYDYARGSLPNCDDFASRSFLLTIASCLTDQDVADIVKAFQKVARVLL
jgi:8-amino-3,8-dideoxy-alpha-D-manno-octulosonate transaminase